MYCWLPSSPHVADHRHSNKADEEPWNPNEYVRRTLAAIRTEGIGDGVPDGIASANSEEDTDDDQWESPLHDYIDNWGITRYVLPKLKSSFEDRVTKKIDGSLSLPGPPDDAEEENEKSSDKECDGGALLKMDDCATIDADSGG